MSVKKKKKILRDAYALPKPLNHYNTIPLTLYTRRGSRGITDTSPQPKFHQNHLAMSNTADVTGGKPIAVCSLSISGVNAMYILAAFPGRKRKVLFFCFVPNTTQDYDYTLIIISLLTIIPLLGHRPFIGIIT
jgi:hypothetical protein